ncbi:hypothetical protein CCACVL1_23509 [Corchorus capsularis]|uniref:F-box domain-containing protein n=1 Tax=Corchorus capsularis TaxID=210143 RepID=A0A1R3GTP2_COCAP|nr:hypothetical protein CCACVL1_23509 [Corchorus capsularis]
MEHNSEERNWADLPELALELIRQKLKPLRDLFRFGAVCKRWNSILSVNGKKLCRLDECSRQPPFLLIPRDDLGRSFSLYSVTERRILLAQIRSLHPSSSRLIGSSHGWLIFATKTSAISLLHPFSSKMEIHLPAIPHLIPIPGDLTHRQLKSEL